MTEQKTVDYAEYRALRDAAIAVLSSSMRHGSPGMMDELCRLERVVYGEPDPRQRAMDALVDAAQFLLHLNAVAEKAQQDWEAQPDPGALTYTDVIVRAVVTEMVKAGKTGKFGTHYLVDEFDLKALLSCALSWPLGREFPGDLDMVVIQRVQKIVGHQ